MFFLPGRVAATTAIVCFTLPLLYLAFRQRALRPLIDFREGAVLFFVAAGCWCALSLAVNGVAPGPSGEALANFLLLIVFFSFVHALLSHVSHALLLVLLASSAALSALFSLVAYVIEFGFTFYRLIPVGRGGNSLPGAAAIAAGLIALTVLQIGRPQRSIWETIGALAMAAVMAVALLWTQSRGPLLGCGAAVAATLILGRTTRGELVFGALLLSWALATAIIVLEDPIRTLLCVESPTWCRASYRGEIWRWVVDAIAAHPIVGTGPTFRFPQAALSEYSAMSHPHNGVFGLVMYFGPLFLVATLVALFLLMRNFSRIESPTERRYVIGGLVFSAVYMGTNLPNPFGFVNMHYLFLWMPVFWLASYSDPQVRTCPSCDADPAHGAAASVAPALNKTGARSRAKPS
jgi:O-antigen ligase